MLRERDSPSIGSAMARWTAASSSVPPPAESRSSMPIASSTFAFVAGSGRGDQSCDVPANVSTSNVSFGRRCPIRSRIRCFAVSSG